MPLNPYSKNLLSEDTTYFGSNKFFLGDQEDVDNIMFVKCDTIWQSQPINVETSRGKKIPHIKERNIECHVSAPIFGCKKPKCKGIIDIKQYIVNGRKRTPRVNGFSASSSKEGFTFPASYLFETLGNALRNRPVYMNKKDNKIAIQMQSQSSGDRFKKLMKKGRS